MLELGVKFLISYFIGSVLGAMVIGFLRGGVDIRTMGSGNAGGTNALRTQGVTFALGVVVIDVGKGVIGAGVIPGLDLPFVGIDPTISRDWLTVCCAAAAVIGHVWPIYHRFEGGKGAATYIVTLLVLSPKLLLVVLVAFVVVLVLSGFVGLSTMSAGIAVPAWIWLAGPALLSTDAHEALFVYTFCMALFLVYCHRANIQRMRDGVENRNPKVMLFKPRTADE